MKTSPVILLWVLAVICCSAAKHSWKHGENGSSNNDAPENSKSAKKNNDSNASPYSGPDTGIAQQQSGELQKRAVPAVVAEAGKEIATDLIKEAVDKQIKIIEEQQQKAQEFIDRKLELNIEPEKGWKTESMYVPSGVHVDAEYISGGKDEEDHAGEQPFSYPMGIGGVMMNGCYGTNYQIGDPCYDFKTASTICLGLIDGAAFIGVGFDGRGDYSPESRKMSIVQRVCAGKATYDNADVPDTMNVHGVYDTSTSMHSFYSRQEYQTWLQQEAGMSGSFFGFYAGVKRAWGSSTLSGSEKYMSLLSVDIDRYEIYLDEVKPNDLSVNFLQEFMDLPTSYLAPGAAIKFQNFILRWGTHYIKSGKFGGRLQIFKTMDARQVSSKEEFSQVMEVGYKSLFSSVHAKYESGGGSSAKSKSKTSSTSISVEGGDQEIAAIITDFNSPTIKYDLTKWLASIATFPKPFKFMVAPITDLLKFNPSSLFPNEERNWGCEVHTADMKQDAKTKEHYYEVKVNETVIRKLCPYKDRGDLAQQIELRRNDLERAIAVYMEEGPISASDISLPPGRPGCQTENYKFQQKVAKPSWKDMTEGGATFLVIFNIAHKLKGLFNGLVNIYPSTQKYVRYFKGEWLVGDSRDQIDVITGCNLGELETNKICILGLVLTYHEQTGFLTLAEEDFKASKKAFKSLQSSKIDSLIAHAEWPSEYIFLLDKVVGYLPCNVKWSNVLRFDPSNEEGKCLHFTASSKGTIFVIFAAVPSNKDTWYYVQISPYGVGIFKSQQLMVSTVDVNAVGLGAAILYQAYFVCLKETSQSAIIEYGKSQGTTEKGDVYLTMIDRDDPLFVRFYSFGNGEEPLEIVHAHIISRHLTKANCRGGTVLDKETNMCVQNCHELCDPTQGCRGTTSGKPSAKNCNVCRYVKNIVTGQCLKECPKGWKELDNICRAANPCEGVLCLNGGKCSSLNEGEFRCHCATGFEGNYCEKGCPEGWVTNGASCYFVSINLKKVSSASKKCQRMGAHLPIIKSKEENDFIWNLLKERSKDWAWLGLQRNETDSKFYWLDGTPLEGNYDSWNSGEPNNASGKEDCAFIVEKTKGNWTDHLCKVDGGIPVICERAL